MWGGEIPREQKGMRMKNFTYELVCIHKDDSLLNYRICLVDLESALNHALEYKDDENYKAIFINKFVPFDPKAGIKTWQIK